MTSNSKKRDIQTRLQLFKFLQEKMTLAHSNLQEKQRFDKETTLVKSYLFEINVPDNIQDVYNKPEFLDPFVSSIFKIDNRNAHVELISKEEPGFYELRMRRRSEEISLYVDAISDRRFWTAYSISSVGQTDWWLNNVMRERSDFDFLWMWPKFLEQIQQRGLPRGFGLDYDYRKFQDEDTDTTTYIKMQMWGGKDTLQLYEMMKDNNEFQNKIVLSKIRFQEFLDEHNTGPFAIQEVKYTGKFTARGTSFTTHAATLTSVRDKYKLKIEDIENSYALSWKENDLGRIALEGFAIHFTPHGFELPVDLLYEKAFDGTEPFRLVGFPNRIGNNQIAVEAVDLHTGGELSFEISPDRLTAYLPEGTCGNTIARLYTNLQHSLNVQFSVEADNGNRVF